MRFNDAYLSTPKKIIMFLINETVSVRFEQMRLYVSSVMRSSYLFDLQWFWMPRHLKAILINNTH